VIHLEYQGDMCVSRSPIYINVGGVRVGMGGVLTTRIYIMCGVHDTGWNPYEVNLC